MTVPHLLSDSKQSARSTIIIVPRERFGLAVRSLGSVVEFTNPFVPIVYVDAGSPKKTAQQLRKMCDKRGIKYIRREEFLTPTQARNLGATHAQTEFFVFLDNDVIVSKNWLERLEECAIETNVEAVAPLTCQREPLHQEVHQAGGQVFENFSAFFDATSENPKLVDRHLHQGEAVENVDHERVEIECFEFHCVLIRRRAFEQLGPFDTELFSTKEHIDFSLSIWKNGGRIMMEPRAIVTYLFPDRGNPLMLSDWSYFILRWSPQWQRKSLTHFAKKWGLEGDDYFASRERVVDWRYREGIIKPPIKRVPFWGNRHKFQGVAQSVLMPFVRAWGSLSVRRHAKQLDS